MNSRRLPAGAGLDWLRKGFALYRKAPGTWTGLTLLMFVGMVLISLIPILGGLVVQILMPMVYGGLALGCRALDRGERFNLDAIWAGFMSPYRGRLLGFALLYLLMFAVLGGIALLFFKLTGLIPAIPHFGVQAPQLVKPTLIQILVFILVVGTLASLIGMASWLAPALITLGGQGPVNAMRLSFQASLRSWLALLVFGLIVIAAMLALVLAVGLLSALVGKLVFVVLPLLALLVFWPTMLAVNYCAYLDLFGVPSAVAPELPAEPL